MRQSSSSLPCRLAARAAAAHLDRLLLDREADLAGAAADRIAFMAQGRLLTEGEVEAVLADSRLAEEYLGVAK